MFTRPQCRSLILLAGAPAFYLTRFVLGSCESGFIPASLYTISRFYKRDETSKRFSWFFIGNHFATAVSGFIAYVSVLSKYFNGHHDADVDIL